MKELTAQLKKLLEGKKTALIVTHQHIDGDGLSAMLVVKKLFEKQGLEVTALSSDEIPDIFHFLPGVNEVSANLRNSHDFIISLKAKNAEVDKLKYSIDGDTLNIVVTPKKGTFFPEDVVARQAIGEYDIIVVLDSGDLEHLGAFYEENTEMFYSTPVVNIDHHVTNTAFGLLNFVDVTSASTTQIVYNIIQDFEENPQDFINPDIATLLLTGLVVDTGSFQHTNTSPKSLELAADLIESGARQQEIIQNIYKTKQLSTLKLWGRVLAKIEEDPIHKIVWSTITRDDLSETGASVDEAEGLIDELMTNAPGAEVIVLLKDSHDGVMSASLRSTGIAINTLPIASHFGGGGHQQSSGFKQKGHNFSRFTADVIGYIEQYQEERLGLSAEDIEALRSEYEERRKKTGLTPVREERSMGEKMDILSEIASNAAEQDADNKAQQKSAQRNQQNQGQKEPQRQGQNDRKPQQQEKKQEQPRQEQRKNDRPSGNEQRSQQNQGQKEPQRQGQNDRKPQQQEKVEEQTPPVQNLMNTEPVQSVQMSPENLPQETVVAETAAQQIEPMVVSSSTEYQEPIQEPQEDAVIPEEAQQEALEPVLTPVDQSSEVVEIEQESSSFESPDQLTQSLEQPLTQVAQESQEVSIPSEQIVQENLQTNQEPAIQSFDQQQQVQQQYQNYQQAPQQQQVYQQQAAYAAPQQQQVYAQQQQQPQITKEQAVQYAQYYAQQLQQMNPQTQEYAQVYQYYVYYAQMAQ